MDHSQALTPYLLITYWLIGFSASCSYAHSLPKSGETIRGRTFNYGFGGKGCNQCVAAKNLGGKCLLVAKVKSFAPVPIGSDFFGKSYFNKLIEYDIPREFVKTTEEAFTGVAQITVSDSGENHIVIVPGANDLLNKEDVLRAAEPISNCKVLLCQLEIPETSTIEALQIKAKSKTGISIFNAAPANRNLNPLLYTLPDIFCVNETEAEALVDMTVKTVPQAIKAATCLLEKGCKKVIVTLGEEGSVYGKSGCEKFLHIPAKNVSVTDTTGAGDAFLGALAFLLAKRPDLSMESVIRRATNVAALSVQRVGTQESFPSIGELPDDFLLGGELHVKED